MLVLQLTPHQVHAAEAPVLPPAWSADPRVPGADLPPAGASLFDLVTTDAQGRRQIPFPFERLLARIEAAAGCSERIPCTRSVLIPLGRSLQRAAASPDFFAHPRVVSAVVEAGSGPFMLRDRLYLGYQDKADLIEVLSYNEALGRFEFQLIKNYRSGTAAEVVYAPRVMCVACHQNHGPIFSRQVWLETNANPEIAARLDAQGSIFHGVAARATTETANAIDDATDRANRLALVQRLWNEACGNGSAGERCRKGALIAALQYGLTGRRAYERTAAEFQRDVVGTIAAGAKARWPAGIAIPNPDLPNRDPLLFAQRAEGMMLADIPARFEPLLPRAPLEVLAPDGRELADELVRGLVQFWSEEDFVVLDRALRQRGVAADTRTIAITCGVDTADRRVQFSCGSHPSATDPRNWSSDKTELAGMTEGVEGTLLTMALGGADPLRQLHMDVVRHDDLRAPPSADLTISDGKRLARLPDGNLVQEIVLKWSPARAQGVATVTIRDDFAEVVRQLEASAGTIRSAWVSQIAARLRGERVTEVPATTAVALPDAVAAQQSAAALPFEPECGNCHRTAQRTPPNFLTGNAERVNAALASCAPRILVRMAMHEVPPGKRAKTPMPPEFAGLPGETASVSRVVDSASLEAARRSVEALLRREYGHVPTADELLVHGYESLRPCLGPETTMNAH